MPQFSIRPATLAGVILVTIALFAVTCFITQRYEAEQRALARHAFARGNQELISGQPEKAVADLRTALFYSRENRQYRLRLAEALAASGRTDEAISHFQTLWDSAPGDGLINLQLARLAARKLNLAQALRFYHGAIYGVWEKDPVAQRLQVRLELINFLLQENSKQQAESELIAAAEVLPDDAGLHTRVGDLFMKIPDYGRALAQYQLALKLSPRDAGALLGVGQAAYQLGQYRTAQQYLEKGAAGSPQGAQEAQSLLETIRTLFQINPFQPRLSSRERASRVVSAFQRAGERLQECAQLSGEQLQVQPAATPLQQLHARWVQERRNVTIRALARDSDLIDPAMDLVFDIEQQTTNKCGGSADVVDKALLLISRNREGWGQ
ncbi:MAG: tetratricopeptide repeat protein [Terriglobales bacterium]